MYILVLYWGYLVLLAVGFIWLAEKNGNTPPLKIKKFFNYIALFYFLWDFLSLHLHLLIIAIKHKIFPFFSIYMDRPHWIIFDFVVIPFLVSNIINIHRPNRGFKNKNKLNNKIMIMVITIFMVISSAISSSALSRFFNPTPLDILVKRSDYIFIGKMLSFQSTDNIVEKLIGFEMWETYQVGYVLVEQILKGKIHSKIVLVPTLNNSRYSLNVNQSHIFMLNKFMMYFPRHMRTIRLSENKMEATPENVRVVQSFIPFEEEFSEMKKTYNGVVSMLDSKHVANQIAALDLLKGQYSNELAEDQKNINSIYLRLLKDNETSNLVKMVIMRHLIILLENNNLQDPAYKNDLFEAIEALFMNTFEDIKLHSFIAKSLCMRVLKNISEERAFSYLIDQYEKDKPTIDLMYFLSLANIHFSHNRQLLLKIVDFPMIEKVLFKEKYKKEDLHFKPIEITTNRRLVVEMMYAIRSPNHIEVWKKLLRDEDSQIQDQAVRILIGYADFMQLPGETPLGDASLVPFLEDILLNEPNYRHKYNLGKFILQYKNKDDGHN